MVWFGKKGMKLLQQGIANALLLVLLFGLFQSVRVSDPDHKQENTELQTELRSTIKAEEPSTASYQSAGPAPISRQELRQEIHKHFQFGRIQFQWDTDTGFDALYLFYTLVGYFFIYTIRTKLNEPT